MKSITKIKDHPIDLIPCLLAQDPKGLTLWLLKCTYGLSIDDRFLIWLAVQPKIETESGMLMVKMRNGKTTALYKELGVARQSWQQSTLPYPGRKDIFQKHGLIDGPSRKSILIPKTFVNPFSLKSPQDC